jgi:hypothetical protein
LIFQFRAPVIIMAEERPCGLFTKPSSFRPKDR